MVTRAISNCVAKARNQGWKKTYWAFDIHGTILKPTFESGAVSKEFYPYAKEALQLTENAVGVFEKADEKALHLSFRQLVSQRVDCLVQLERPKQAVKELGELHKHFESTGVNQPVLNQISNLAETIGSAPADKIEEYAGRHRLWERVRTHDHLASVAGIAELAGVKRKRTVSKKARPTTLKARTAAKKATKKARKR